MIVQISNIRVPLSRARNSKVLSSFFPNDTHAFTHTLRISDAPVLLLQRWLEHTRRKVSERVKASWGVCRESSPTSAFANRRARNTIIPWNRGKVESLNECRVSGPRKRANARLGERERERESALPLSERGWCSVWSCVDSRARFLTSVKDEDDRWVTRTRFLWLSRRLIRRPNRRLETTRDSRYDSERGWRRGVSGREAHVGHTHTRTCPLKKTNRSLETCGAVRLGVFRDLCELFVEPQRARNVRERGRRPTLGLCFVSFSRQLFLRQATFKWTLRADSCTTILG